MFFVCPTVYCQNLPQPLTQVDACQKIRSSVVQVDTETMHGSGFIVDEDGWIVTALHVVADPETLVKREKITVSALGHQKPIPAEIVSPLDKTAQVRDFAILKVNEPRLRALELGNEADVEDGSPITIVGLPLSAMFRFPINPVPRFCLSGTIAAQTALPLGNLEFLHTIYFQGVSIKGISGAPIVSLVTGKVIGIVSTRMTGIDAALQHIRDNFGASETDANDIGAHSSIIMHGIDPARAFGAMANVLDEQLANGLGTGTGAAYITDALKRAQQSYKKTH
ncbi:MAG: serine protease [Candidatus Sulfotelmatobacter sp.]